MSKYSCYCCYCLQGIPPDLAPPPLTPSFLLRLDFCNCLLDVFPSASSSHQEPKAFGGMGCVPGQFCTLAPGEVPMLGWNFLPLPVPHHVPKAGLGMCGQCKRAALAQLTSAAREAAGTEDWQQARVGGCVQAADPACLCFLPLPPATSSPLPPTASHGPFPPPAAPHSLPARACCQSCPTPCC